MNASSHGANKSFSRLSAGIISNLGIISQKAFQFPQIGARGTVK
jgi:hypothetical protein